MNKYLIKYIIIGMGLTPMISLNATDDCCDDGNPPAFTDACGKSVCDAPPENQGCCNETTYDKTTAYCNNGALITASDYNVSYDGPTKVWVGEVVTWTVSGPLLSRIHGTSTNQTGGFNQSSGVMTVTITGESGSTSEKKMPIELKFMAESGDYVDLSVDDGPVAYKLNSAQFTANNICEEDATQLVITTTPVASFEDYPSGLDFTSDTNPDDMDSQGNIEQGNSLAPGSYVFKAIAGGAIKSDTLKVVTGKDGEWTQVAPGGFNDSTPDDEAFSGAYVTMIIWDPPYETRGHLRYSQSTDFQNDKVSSTCGAQVTQSDHTSYTQGVSGGLSFYGVSANIGVRHESSITYEVSWPASAEPGKNTKVTVLLPMRTGKWNAEEWNDHGTWKPMPDGPLTLQNITWVRGPADANVYQQCCAGS